MKKCVIIYNPLSGKKEKSKFMPKVIHELNKEGYSAEVINTEYKGHATEIVKNLDKVDLVMSMGGDGTFNESVTGNYQRKEKLVLAHIPVGTTNDVGKMLGYGKSVIENVKMTLQGQLEKFDICLINNKPFVYVAGIGKFADVPYETPRKLKKKIGYLAYIGEGIKSFRNKTKLQEIVYEVDGEKYHGLFSFIIISSANRIAGIPNFYKDVKLDDNKFEVLLCNITKKKDIIKSIYFLTMYDASKVPGIYYYKTDNFKVKFAEPPKKAWCIDGEELKEKGTNYEIKIYDKMKLLVPKKNIDKLFINKN